MKPRLVERLLIITLVMVIQYQTFGTFVPTIFPISVRPDPY